MPLFPLGHPRGGPLFDDHVAPFWSITSIPWQTGDWSKHELQGLQQTLSRADAIVTDSFASRAVILAAIPGVVPPVVIYPGISRFPVCSKVLARHSVRWLGVNVDAKVILAVSSPKPHKNIDLLLHAFAGVRRRVPTAQLVVAGAGFRGPRLAAWYEWMRRHRLDQGVVIIGPVTEQELAHLYMAADLFVFPSATEGFGMPPCEAVLTGLPVVVPNIPVFQEVLGPLATAVEPNNSDALLEAMCSGSRCLQ